MSRPDAGEDRRLARPDPRRRVSPVGYAIGTGVAVMALVGPVLHFAIPGVSDWLHFGGSFGAGAVLGGMWATLRPHRLD